MQNKNLLKPNTYYLNNPRQKKPILPIPIPKLTQPQYDFLFSTEPAAMFEGAIGSGKSFVLTLKTFILALSIPNTNHMLAAYTMKMLKDSLYPHVGNWLEYLPKNMYTFKRFDAEIHFVNGSQINFRQLDEEGKARGPNYTSIGIDELTVGINEETFFQVLGRLRESHKGWFFTATNPGAKSHFAYDYFHLPTAEEAKYRKVYKSTTYDNKDNLPDFYIRELESRPESWKKRFLLGEWGTMKGMVYDTFDRHHHTQELDYNPSLDTFITMDHGFDAPFAALLMQWDKPNRRFYVLKEYYKSGNNTNEHCEYIEDYFMPFNPLFALGDSQDANANDIIKKRLKLRMKVTTKVVTQGIYEVQNHLQNRNDSLPGLIIDKSCKNLILEFESYEYKRDKQGDRLGRGGVKKKKDHLLDALRYAIMTLAGMSKKVIE